MLDKIVKDGRRLVVIVDPHVKKDDNFLIYANMKGNKKLSV
jgi:alpha-glucosidase (family GH31 glycosyl hydrolase)